MKLNKLSLNTIGLNRIGLNRIGSTSVGSSATDRPYISPDVLSALAGVWIADGKSNTDPDRNIIKNKLPGRGGDFEIFNAAYEGMSSYNGYPIVLGPNKSYRDMASYGNIIGDDKNIISITNIVSTSALLYSYIKTNGNLSEVWNKDYPSCKIKVTGITEGLILRYLYLDNPDATVSSAFYIKNDGTYIIPKSYKNGGSLIEPSVWIGFSFSGTVPEQSNINIEFLPEYEGSFVTDGVNDMIVSQNPVSEMLGGSNELTVVSMIHQITGNENYTNGYTNYIRHSGGFIRNIVAGKDGKGLNKTGIYGYTSTQLDSSNMGLGNVINNILGDKEDYAFERSSTYILDDAKYSVQNFINGEGNVSNEGSQVAWYWTFIAKRALTTDEINQVIAYYNLDKHVMPDIYYDVKKQGLTNDTPDEDWYLKDFSGNGRDMTLYNYARTPESGINEEGGLQSDGVDDYGQFVGDLGLKDYTVAADRSYQDENVNCVPFISSVGRTGGAPFLMEYVHPTLNVVYPYSYDGTTGTVLLNSSRQISYQSTYVYNRNSIARGNSVKTGDGLTIGSNEGVSQYSKLCLWSFLLFPYTLSEFLLERQLKKHKLGTLYRGMVEFRPIVKSNIPYSSISYSANPGEYVIEGSTVTITITLSNSSDKLVDISSNAISDMSISGDNGVYEVTGKVTKSPQKINIVISSYLTMLDNETLITNETLIKNE